ncbi:uncharacterized protein EI97DRAFT_456749 [Westerdykella ornata]|uniref:MPN domain-containing protein n=1 Tax=Westerdykella ornata TaxID=318751 RepID=A0A6A6JNY3_WESOR|nr:uncharacterized protein EI97DRAFT_456749 [Westerdykella ornata]KAF2278331.1 hypothetical protein EI97DRAFT_456749 [Westerdykella ornata]
MASLGAPLSVAEITRQAENFEYDSKIQLRHWLRSADTMLKEAHVYEAEGNDVQTYLLLYRHAKLVLEHLAKHPERTLAENRKALSAANAAVARNLAKLEVIRPRIAKRHEEYQARRNAQRMALEMLEGLDAKNESLAEKRYSKRRSFERATLDAGQNRLLAAKLAQREVRRRDSARRTVRSQEEDRTGGLWVDWGNEGRRSDSETDDDLSRQLQEVARLQDEHKTQNFSRPTSHPPTYHYPSIPHRSTHERWPGTDAHLPTQGTAPARPPKEQIYRESGTPARPPPVPPKPPTAPTPPPFENPRPPPIPGKILDSESQALPIPPPIPGKYSPSPTPQLPTPPAEPLDEFTFKPSAYLENGTPLRTVFLPNTLRSHFLAAASPNTRLNLETCGILCGILKSNALFVTRLLIPEQTSTSDTCETLNEEEYFDYCDREELMVLGWIHTHPTQTCFMSSRDLHTHVGYQVMLPESVAVVCAPSKQPSWGIFRLTDPPGKQTILNCNQPGIFHPHAVDNIYTEAVKPGHVVELANAPLEVVDMRPKGER